MRIPLSLMRMALALIDRDGDGRSDVACLLQGAIDRARSAKPLVAGQEIQPDLLGALDRHDLLRLVTMCDACHRGRCAERCICDFRRDAVDRQLGVAVRNDEPTGAQS